MRQQSDLDDKRLDRIEEKLDGLTKVVTDLARLEERMITLFRRMDRYDEQITEVAAGLAAVERAAIKRGAVGRLFERGLWLIFGAAITWLFSKGLKP